ncbi:MAG: FAD-dependent oxidoreductase [Nitrososphaerota archaeon]|nr:FAD-dependent oxidoreductase [Candidatus Calditenuaceae archaeon]MDW8072786.1 FAD-dependent oxidoreductase [Nitrososphaerota archaeon]
MKPDYDVIVVGGGNAGCAAANYLARKGVDVALLEKAQVPGQKNVTGGVIYTEYIRGYSLEDAFPGFREEAPLERRIVSHEVVVLSSPETRDGKAVYKRTVIGEDSLLNRLGISGFNLAGSEGYSVLRAKFDKWMMKKVTESGGVVVTYKSVKDLYFENNQVKGIVTDSETVTCNLVIDASGVTSRLVDKAGLRPPLTPEKVYHGVKHVYKLSQEKIEERFGLKQGEGKAIFYLGDVMQGVSGGAFLYTNRDTLSIGIVASLDSFLRASLERMDTLGKPLEILESLESHPAVAPLLEGAELVEYSAHNIPKGYKTMLEQPYTSGYVVTGDALGAFVKIGGLIDGMRRAVATGIMAAEAYLRASKANDYSAKTLAVYKELLAPIYSDVRKSGRNAMLTESRVAYGLAPKLLLGLLGERVEAQSQVRSHSSEVDAVKKIQERTGLLDYDEDKEYSHIKVDFDKASAQRLKMWVPACPVNCYTLVLEKGVFASLKDLYRYNLSRRLAEGIPENRARSLARMDTLDDMARARLNFDHVACVACGTCGVIGPTDVIDFGHEREGHGVRFKYG